MDYGQWTISDTAPLLRRGELTPLDLVDRCFERIDRYEAKVRAWVFLDRDRARADAQRLTDELKRGEDRGPLHGIPVGIKDIIDVFDMPTACGSKLWANSYARKDATCVARLRQAGAIILGKTVTTPFAYLDPPPTRNPWNLERTPGGSSSGSAAAVACGMCFAALGTQTGGSVTRPASFCGVYSLKPTHGRISLEGILPLAPSLDHVGVMANCVRDLGLVYRVLADAVDGEGVHDPIPIASSWGMTRVAMTQFEQHHTSFQLTNDFFPDRTDPAMRSPFVDLIRKLTPIDSKRFEDLVLPPEFAQIPAAHLALMSAGAAAYHRERLDARPKDYPPKITELIRMGQSVSGADVSKAQSLQFVAWVGLHQRGMSNPLLIPATTGPAPTPETTGNPGFNSVWSFLGLPTVSLPFDRTADGLPLCVQLVGEKADEDRLLKSAAELESLIGYASPSLPL